MGNVPLQTKSFLEVCFYISISHFCIVQDSVGKDAYPDNEGNKAVSILTWNQSDERKMNKRFVDEVWEKSEQSKNVTKTDFNKVAHIVKFELHNLIRGRSAAYSFDKNAYRSKCFAKL